MGGIQSNTGVTVAMDFAGAVAQLVVGNVGTHSAKQIYLNVFLLFQ